MAEDLGAIRRRARRIRGRGHLRRLGPGLITGASDDDPSGIGTYSQVGASMGYGLLWTAIVSLPLASAVQETAARLGFVTGKGLAALIRIRFRRPVLSFAVLLVVAANVFNIGADLGAMAASAQLVLPIPFAVLLIGFTAIAILLEVFLSYARYARILRWLTASLLAYIVVLFVVNVDWNAVLRGTFLPSFGGSRAELAALIAIFGTTISPYLFFWQASEEVEEEEPDTGPPHITKERIRAVRIDVIAGMSSAVIVMFAIMVSSAATLGAHGVTTVQTADQAAKALEPIAGSIAGLLFALGIVGTGSLAVPVLAGSTAYAISESVGWDEGLSRKLRAAPGFYAVIVGSMLLGLVLNFVGLDPIRALYLSAILNGLAAPPLILLMLILSNDKKLLGTHSGRRLSNVLLATALLLMTALPIAYLLS
jgi:NRAMP (natural resistance-associated macrophage protein)-like metal ion transporter